MSILRCSTHKCTKIAYTYHHVKIVKFKKKNLTERSQLWKHWPSTWQRGMRNNSYHSHSHSPKNKLS